MQRNHASKTGLSSRKRHAAAELERKYDALHHEPAHVLTHPGLDLFKVAAAMREARS